MGIPGRGEQHEVVKTAVTWVCKELSVAEMKSACEGGWGEMEGRHQIMKSALNT